MNLLIPWLSISTLFIHNVVICFLALNIAINNNYNLILKFYLCLQPGPKAHSHWKSTRIWLFYIIYNIWILFYNFRILCRTSIQISRFTPFLLKQIRWKFNFMLLINTSPNISMKICLIALSSYVAWNKFQANFSFSSNYHTITVAWKD